MSITILTMIDNKHIYNVINDLHIFSKENNNTFTILPDITYIEGIKECLEVYNNITHLIINYEIFEKSNMNLHEILQFLITIKSDFNSKHLNKSKNLEIIILISNDNLELKEKLQLIDINKIFMSSNIDFIFLYNIISNNSIKNLNTSNDMEKLLNNLISLENNNIKTNENYINKLNNKFNSNMPNIFTNITKCLSKIINYTNSIKINKLKKVNKKNKDCNINKDSIPNLYNFKDIKNEYLKKLKINENNSKYNLSNSTIKLKSNISNNNIKLLDLPLSNLMENCQKIEIILSNKEDI
jgi:erythrocyte membrane-associated antigen